MITIITRTAVLCASLLTFTNAPASQRFGGWVLGCDAGACGIGTSIEAKDDPAHFWLKVLLSREGEDLRMEILTPPVVNAQIRTSLNDAGIWVSLDGTCDGTKCVFSEALNEKREHALTSAARFTVEVRTSADDVSQFEVDLNGLDAALAHLPRDL